MLAIAAGETDQHAESGRRVGGGGQVPRKRRLEDRWACSEAAGSRLGFADGAQGNPRDRISEGIQPESLSAGSASLRPDVGDGGISRASRGFPGPGAQGSGHRGIAATSSMEPAFDGHLLEAGHSRVHGRRRECWQEDGSSMSTRWRACPSSPSSTRSTPWPAASGDDPPNRTFTRAVESAVITWDDVVELSDIMAGRARRQTLEAGHHPVRQPGHGCFRCGPGIPGLPGGEGKCASVRSSTGAEGSSLNGGGRYLMCRASSRSVRLVQPCAAGGLTAVGGRDASPSRRRGAARRPHLCGNRIARNVFSSGQERRGHFSSARDSFTAPSCLQSGRDCRDSVDRQGLSPAGEGWARGLDCRLCDSRYKLAGDACTSSPVGESLCRRSGFSGAWRCLR